VDSKGYAAIFLLALSLRLLPEILSWPWLIGWDTPEYVASLRDFKASPSILGKSVWYGGERLLPPLLNVFLYPLTFLMDPWYLFKIVPPIIYGLEVTMFLHLAASLGLDQKQAYISSLICAFYSISLRMS